jgi:hypothetical protein
MKDLTGLTEQQKKAYSDGVQPAPVKVATTTLYAIAYDKEETRGDSDFNIDTCVEYNGESFKDLVKKFSKEFPGMDKKSIVGFWIVPESVKKVFDNSYFNVCGNDSAVYAQNAMMKGIAKGNAVKIVVKGSK